MQNETSTNELERRQENRLRSQAWRQRLRVRKGKCLDCGSSDQYWLVDARTGDLVSSRAGIDVWELEEFLNSHETA